MTATTKPALSATASGMRCVLFDFDGTLVDSSPGILTSFRRTLARHGLEPALPLTQALIGPPLAKTLARISGLDEGEIGPMIATFKADYDQSGFLDTEPYEGAAETLAALAARGLGLYIVTNKRMVPTRKILAHLGWEPHFAGVYSLDSMTPPVADKSAMVHEILLREGLDSMEAAFIGDSAEDARAATENNMRFFAAAWGYGGLAEAARHPEWTRLSRLAELLHHTQG